MLTARSIINHTINERFYLGNKSKLENRKLIFSTVVSIIYIYIYNVNKDYVEFE